ncbi:MAG TPA: hypothetical protein PJ994_03095 [Tepidiformaceae bacterium]|nr:hypothetical protein [Tepidiformaceae bacterium]
MELWMWITIAAVAALTVVAFVIWAVARMRRTDKLRNRYGDEYERVVSADGRRDGEAELIEREKKVRKLEIRPLTTAEGQRFASLWQETQARFVDQPGGALADADRLVGAADISVDHPNLVDHYRTAHSVAERHGRGQATTEEMRQAMIHYRALFSELLELEEVGEPPSSGVDRPR